MQNRKMTCAFHFSTYVPEMEISLCASQVLHKKKKIRIALHYFSLDTDHVFHYLIFIFTIAKKNRSACILHVTHARQFQMNK
jgi:hypothetical protein